MSCRHYRPAAGSPPYTPAPGVYRNLYLLLLLSCFWVPYIAATPALAAFSPEKITKTSKESGRERLNAPPSGSRAAGTSRAQVLQEPAPVEQQHHNIVERNPRYIVRATYPSFGQPRIDSELALWVRQRIDTFVEGIEAIPAEAPLRYSLSISYSLFQPSPRYVSIIFFITTNTGDPLTDQGMATFSYDIHQGRLLDYPDIFARRDSLFSFFSSFCHRQLAVAPRKDDDHRVFSRGLTPEASNFSFFTLTPTGMSIYFPPSQVAPAQEGTQRVDIPLLDLIPYSPLLPLWGKAGGPTYRDER